MSTLRLTTISNQGGTASVPSDTVINGSAKAWVNFNGTGTVAIRGSFNVSSITDNGTGDYTVNFTNALADANFATTGACYSNNNSNIAAAVDTFSQATSNSRVRTIYFSGSSFTATTFDSSVVNIAIFR